MDFVLDEIVDQWHQRSKEQRGKDLAPLDGVTVHGRQRETTQGPRQRKHQIRDHEDVVPGMVVRRRDVDPSTAEYSPQQAHGGHELGSARAGTRGDKVPEDDQGEAGTRRDRDEHLEDGSFGIPVANRRRNGGKPFLRITLLFRQRLQMQARAIRASIANYVHSTRSSQSYGSVVTWYGELRVSARVLFAAALDLPVIR